MSILAPRHEYIENLYNYHDGNIHHIMNNYDLDGDDFELLTDLKAFNNGY